MGSMNINFAEVESGSFDAIPKGLYPAIIEKCEVRESKSSDHNYLNFEFTITDGEFEGRKQWMINSFSPNALFRMKDTFEALGFDMEAEDFEFEWDDDVEITPQAGPLLLTPDVSGMACVLVVEIDMWESKERNRVNEIRPADDDAPAAKSSSAAKKSNNSRAKAGSGSGRRALR